MTEWQATYKKQGWVGDTKLHYPQTGTLEGGNPLAHLTAEVLGEFVVVSCWIGGTKVFERRSAVEDPMRAAVLMNELLGQLRNVIGNQQHGLVPQPPRIR